MAADYGYDNSSMEALVMRETVQLAATAFGPGGGGG